MDTSYAIANHYNLSTSQVQTSKLLFWCARLNMHLLYTVQPRYDWVKPTHVHILWPFPSFSFCLLILSSIQVPAKTDCVMCFGPVVPDGYGVCYNPMEKHINFAVSAFNNCADTSARRLAHALEDALLDMKSLLDQTLKSKLWGTAKLTAGSVIITLKYLRKFELLMERVSIILHRVILWNDEAFCIVLQIWWLK